MEISVNEGRTGLEEWSNDSKEAVGEGKNVRRSNRRRKRGGEANEIDAFIPVTVSTSRYNFIETKLSPVDIQFPGGGTSFPTFRRWNNSALRLDRTDDGRRREIERKRERGKGREENGTAFVESRRERTVVRKRVKTWQYLQTPTPVFLVDCYTRREKLNSMIL